MKTDCGVPSLGLSIDLSISVQSQHHQHQQQQHQHQQQQHQHQQQQQSGSLNGYFTKKAAEVEDDEAERRGSTMDLLPRPAAAHKKIVSGLLWQSLFTKARSDDSISNGTELAPPPPNYKGLDMNTVPCSGEADESGHVSTSFQLMAADSQPASASTKVATRLDQAKRERDTDEVDQMTSSRAASDEEEGGTRKKLRLSKEQSALLEESFREHSTLNPKQKNALAKQLNLRPRQVEVWFQNRRARTKLKQTEVDCELLKKYCEGLSEENRRLQKEVQELRSLKIPPCVITHDFYMPLPATTLTMCPSCERLASTDTNTSTAASAAAAAAGSSSTTKLLSSKPLSTSFQNAAATMARFPPQPRTTASLLQPV